ncbi:MAG: DUF6273 domain-containing protein [Saccharofermentans sp.]|nr:DUF6273 domain-containing protein [Saccharofermentans sp.]
MKKYNLKLITAGLVGVMAFSMMGCSDKSSSESEEKNVAEETEKVETEPNESEVNESVLPDNDKEIEVGDIITFGNYGDEAITWRVLDKEDGKVLLITENELTEKKYHDSGVSVTWESSTLRAWLNSDFYNEAFSPDEQDEILTTTVIAAPNPEYNIDPGNDTQDKVYLLSIDEVNKYFNSDESRTISSEGSTNCWWLRTPGNCDYFAAFVDGSGTIWYDGNAAVNGYNVVRPAMWISVE